MVHGFKRMGWAWTCLVLAAAAPRLSAQALWIPASDPAGIARAGAGVAFGRNLEATALNPALLATLTESEVFLAAGMEMQSQQITPQSNQVVFFTSDRNRFMPSLGAAWKLAPTWALGLQLGTAYQRHGRLPAHVPARFDGLALDFEAKRIEAQLGWAPRPDLSFGVSAGALLVRFENETAVRLAIANDPTRAVDAGNPSLALAEFAVSQKARTTMPTFSAGFRWAMAPRWTLAGTVRVGGKADLPLEASFNRTPVQLVGNDGFSTAPMGLDGRIQQLLGRVQAVSGQSELKLPAMATVGLRQRVNQVFTWELDARFVDGKQVAFPTLPGLDTPSGRVMIPVSGAEGISGFGFSACGEFSFGKSVVARVGMALDPPYRRDSDVDVLRNGTRTAAFSGGLSWKLLGGELNLGYQVRQTQDRESSNLDAAWSASGYRRTGTIVRPEGSGHLWSVGFKKAF